MKEFRADEHHYMGYLVLQSIDNKNFVIIDGQQRLTTVTIIILAVLYELQQLQDNENQTRLNAIKNSFIGFTNPVTLTPQSKLILNRNNDMYFRQYLCKLREPAERNIIHSNHLIRRALAWFRKNIRGQSGEDMAKLVDELVDCLLFTTITVTKDSNAYSIFETLNARGVKLSVPDLVKNYLFSTIDKDNELHEIEIKDLDEQWEIIVSQLKRYSFSDFIRVDWNSRYEYVGAKGLFKRIKEKIDTNPKATDYLASLQTNSQIYSALRDRSDEFWRTHREGVYNSNPQFKTLSWNPKSF